MSPGHIRWAFSRGRGTDPFNTDPSARRLDGSSQLLFRQFWVYAIGRKVKTKIPASPSKRRIIVNGQTHYRCEKKTSEIGFRGKEHQKISDP